MDLNEMGYEGHKWRDLAQGTVAGFGICGNELSSS